MEGKKQVLYRPKSKWPYWVLYNETHDGTPFNQYTHWLAANQLKSNKIPVVTERQWKIASSLWSSKRKIQVGMLYKFLNEEDRLIFLLEQT